MLRQAGYYCLSINAIVMLYKQPARLAQSVEHGTLNPGVVGSSPTLGDSFLGFQLWLLPLYIWPFLWNSPKKTLLLKCIIYNIVEIGPSANPPLLISANVHMDCPTDCNAKNLRYIYVLLATACLPKVPDCNTHLQLQLLINYTTYAQVCGRNSVPRHNRPVSSVG